MTCFEALDVRSCHDEDQLMIFKFDARLLFEILEAGVKPQQLMACFEALAVRGTSPQDKANYQLDAALILKYLRVGMNP